MQRVELLRFFFFMICRISCRFICVKGKVKSKRKRFQRMGIWLFKKKTKQKQAKNNNIYFYLFNDFNYIWMSKEMWLAELL